MVNMKNIILCLTVLLLIGCKGDLLPSLPDTDHTINDVDTALFNDLNSETDDEQEDDIQVDEENVIDDFFPDIEQNDNEDNDISDEDEPRKVTSLLVATVKGYDVPESGKVYEFDSTTLDMISQNSDDLLFGSETGSDINLVIFDRTFAVLARHQGKKVYFFNDRTEERMTFDTFTEESEDYVNFQDMVYNTVREEYVLSAHSLDDLVVLKNDVFKRKKFTEDAKVFPVRMRAIGEKIYINLQHLNGQWVSEKGVMAVVDMSDYSAEFIDLGVKNPVGKIEYNPSFDRDHIYTTCSGSWAKRDGAIVRINLKNHKVETILTESYEEGSLMDVDIIDISITDNGSFFVVVSDNNNNWVNKLYEFNTKEGKISEVDSGVNAFAANPVAYNAGNDSVFYFCDDKEKTFIKKRNVETGKVDSYELDSGPASIKIWSRFK